MAIIVCFKCIFQIFHLYLTYVQVFSSGCCKSRSGCCIYVHVVSVCFKCFSCFICLLQVFHLDVAYVCNDFKCFPCVLQVFHLGVVKVDLMLHMLQWDPPIIATYCSCKVMSGRR
jgi:hypothetical protein